MIRDVIIAATMREPGDAIPFALWDRVPPSLAAILPNVTWSRERLHRLDLPVVDVAVADLAWQLDLPWWRVDRDYFAVTPNQVRAAPDRHAHQWRRTLGADLAFPIDLLERDRCIILDGVHRLLRASVEGRERVSARLVSVTLFNDLLVER
jgi:hypothetical protein